MVCNKWESDGLLYTSNELSAQQQSSYEQHLEQCTECQEELASYSMMKETIFIPGLLEDAPTFSMDALFDSVESKEAAIEEVAAPVATKKKETFLFGMTFFALMQQRVAPAFLLVMGIFVGYSFLPSASGTQQIASQEPTMHSEIRMQDSAGINTGDTIREFREGGTRGIRAVDVVE